MKAGAVGKFLLVFIAYSMLHTGSSASGNETDRLSLLDFKKAITLDPQQVLASWNDSTHFCSWEGILCTANNPRRVASIRLERRSLVGQISPSLGNLTFLRNLSLATNQFTGEIPASLGHLQYLQYLYLSNNTLQGQIPSFANCSSLRVMWLHRNGLVGQFPADLPSGLRQLQISVNNLSGTIPASLSNITKLAVISCAYNNFVGNVPDEFAKLSNMQQLYLGANQLSGRFPRAIMNFSALTDLSLGLNEFSGEVPPDLGSVLRNLLLFELPVNFFHGPIPPSLTNASNLYYIEISRNNFTGLVPSTIEKLNKLEMLNLEYNQLQAERKQDWEFLGSLANCTELIDFSMTGNRLRGKVPASVGNLTNQLQYLYMSENQLSGEFPPGIANLRNLFIVSLAMNQFSGPLPQWLGSLQNLQKISLGSNLFTGNIPSSISNLSQLGELYLDSNRLVGQIPPSFGNLPILKVINISNNILQGSLPKELFRIPTIAQISLYVNSIDGPIHPDIGNAKQLTYLQLSSNNLSAEIPSTLGNCESLEEIELDYNAFSGNIPVSLGNIRTLKVLNLSHNNISGLIPVSLGNLQLLEQLDLSFNNLKGEVPTKGIFNNATAMQIDGNKDLCGGSLELHLPSCPVRPLNSSRHKLSVVLKVVIPVAVLVSLAVIISVSLLFQRPKQTTQSVSLPLFRREFLKISYSDLVRATEGFATSNLVGQGRYGSVYQGKLFQDGNVVAIKVFCLETRGAQKSFIAECNALRNLRHRNLVPILTACSTVDPKCAGGGQVSTASDVYSFGVVLLEVFIRRRPTDDMFKEEMSITKFTEINFPENVLQIVDPQLLQELDLSMEIPTTIKETGAEILQSVLEVGLCCTRTSPKERINMQVAAAKLHGIRDAYLRGN
ncbi:hypothetical protein PR202_gb16773 [Eleusine coracana subsp. coracana]|uniref:non-specific serine/threonine protein kinase n=1 Tax=Eleusine coracana subsp. coracana TaxID=191504 RepID=A0AAV5F137_ELECO|nr:hypothetical protein PR202_gb16716 [Eleusine coracana subsp. coracana]GJN28625.1 hypothetical protein PR202_gb16773 [Eleusine coracana subsp. coracana]